MHTVVVIDLTLNNTDTNTYKIRYSQSTPMIIKFLNLKNIEMFMKSYLLGCIRLEETVNHRNINWNSLTHNVFLFLKYLLRPG